jgi:hypothetical protein
MAVLPPFFLDTVAAIGRNREDGSIGWTASGFLYGQFVRADGNQRTYEVYLVTNRHVLDGQRSIVVRFGSDGTALAPPIVIGVVDSSGSPTYVLHADPEIDVAVLPIDVELLRIPGTKFSFFQNDRHTMGRSAAVDAELTEGDGAFVLGFPMGQVGGDRNYVIVRHGAIARPRLAGRRIKGVLGRRHCLPWEQRRPCRHATNEHEYSGHEAARRSPPHWDCQRLRSVQRYRRQCTDRQTTRDV